MAKGYSDRSMKREEASDLIEFSFSKHIPPVTIKARTLEDAEAQLKELDNAK